MEDKDKTIAEHKIESQIVVRCVVKQAIAPSNK